jgi:hypothetical protein
MQSKTMEFNIYHILDEADNYFNIFDIITINKVNRKRPIDEYEINLNSMAQFYLIFT